MNETRDFQADEDAGKTGDFASSRFYSLLDAWTEAKREGKSLAPEDLCPNDPEVQLRLKQAIEKLDRIKAFAGKVDESIQPDPDGEPELFGRYKVLRKLGSGGFGEVYLGYDETLDRVVAIKVPRRGRIAKPEQVKAYLAEARLLAGLEHPAIVRVYDCGQNHESCYVVSQYIDGGDLSKWLENNRAEPAWAVQLVIRIAEALHFAHKSRIVHRDVKPSNILLDGGGTAFLCDFGLAMREEDFGRGSGYAGTPRYMSPEQARGEGHRVDNRSDVYSLGVVLYELLRGRVPFVAESVAELLEQIQLREPPPLRLDDETIPKELERITMKALSKRAADRYSTTLDFAADLQYWLDGAETRPVVVAAPTVSETPGSVSPNLGEARPPRLVPKSLRAFDANDADFFLRLLPGPRDRDGLPDAIRFWKSKIENRDEGFSVGLLYGPSGCGKTSFVRAGLLPRVSNAVHCVYVEATPHDTESRLLNALRKYRGDLAKITTLDEMLLQLRRQPQGPVLLVIDQFEQWLAAHPQQETSALLQALRQCDGKVVQALLMVRDDFWMAATRFFHHLEIPLQEGRNSAAVDLFDQDHARKVLAGFGRAFGKLPAKRTDYSAKQNQFLDRAIRGLANDDSRIICVRLALFAEMVKNRPWEPGTLESLGGLDGLGATFLEEQLGDKAPPAHRIHQQAAKGVLKALLPAAGADIKKTLTSRAALLEASGYQSEPAKFDALIQILDSKLRLITPAESDGTGHYQLTHDFLVPSLRDWLNRKQMETRRGRAEILLAERAALWNRQPVKRFLPSAWEWLKIRLFTKSRTWSEPERQMIRTTGRRLVLRTTIIALFAAIAVATATVVNQNLKAASIEKERRYLIEQIATANPYQLPGLVERLNKLGGSVSEEEIEAAEDELAKLQLLVARDSNDSTKLRSRMQTLEDEDPLRLAIMTFIARNDRAIDPLFDLLLNEPGNRLKAVIAKIRKMPDSKVKIASLIESFQGNASQLARLYLASATLGEWRPMKVAMSNTSRPEGRIVIVTESSVFDLDLKYVYDSFMNEARPQAKQAWALLMFQNKDSLNERELKVIKQEMLISSSEGVYSALSLLLKKHGKSSPVVPSHVPRKSVWNINENGLTLMRTDKPPHRFLMGDAKSDRKSDKNVHLRIIDRSFEIGAYEITVADMDKLRPGFAKSVEKFRAISPTPDCPAQVSWFEALEYCNLLSKAEGIPEDQWCFIVERDENGKFKRVEVKPNFLELSGYRLPTEGEWEYAARGGTDLPRHFGSDVAHLKLFGWHLGNANNQLHSVGQLMPNEYGLFDTLGNAMEWTMTAYEKDGDDYPKGGGEVRDGWREADLDPTLNRIARGGAYHTPAADCRSAYRFAFPPGVVPEGGGFRVARTIVKPAE